MKKKKLLFSILAGAFILSAVLFGCDASASSDEMTAYLFFNGQYIKYTGVQNYSVDSYGEVDLKMTDGKHIKLYSPGNVTVVTKDAIPEQDPKQDKANNK